MYSGKFILIGEDGAPFLDKTKSVAFLASGKFWVNNHCHVLKSNKQSIDDFIMYSLNNVDYSNYIKGSTREKLNQSDLANIILPLPSIIEQQEIAI